MAGRNLRDKKTAYIFSVCVQIDLYAALKVRSTARECSQLVTRSTRHWQISKKWQWQRMLYMQIHNHQTLHQPLTITCEKSTCHMCRHPTAKKLIPFKALWSGER